MRCKNCGWVNPDKNEKCEKCNVPLIDAQNEPESTGKPSTAGFNPNETAKGCPGCGYPARMDDISCPNCGRKFGNDKQAPPVVEEVKPVKEQHSAPAPKPAAAQPVSTINPWMPSEKVQVRTPECSLSFVKKEGEPSNDSSLRFSGNQILLNRGNTDPGNQTITSKVQAELTFENDKWYLQDKSALKTTYIYAGEKKELKPGDVIVLGNRLFEFNVPANRPD